MSIIGISFCSTSILSISLSNSSMSGSTRNEKLRSFNSIVATSVTLMLVILHCYTSVTVHADGISRFLTTKNVPGSKQCINYTTLSHGSTTVARARSKLECGILCRKNTSCQTFNYRNRNGECELFFLTVSPVYNVQPGCVNYRPSACDVVMQSWGGLYDPQEDWVSTMSVNGHLYLSVNITVLKQGIYSFLLDTTTCTAYGMQYFDTYRYTSEATRLAAYLPTLPTGTVLVGLSHDEAQQSLTAAAKNALIAVGANVATIGWRSKFAFVAQIGSAQKTVFELRPDASPPRFDMTVRVTAETLDDDARIEEICFKW